MVASIHAVRTRATVLSCRSSRNGEGANRKRLSGKGTFRAAEQP
jgi:hypothetical protein